MKLTEAQADDVLARAGIAAIHYDEDLAIVDPEYSIHRDIDYVLEPLSDVVLDDDERAKLRVLCGRAIADPTGHRAELLHTILTALPESDVQG